MAKRSAGVLLYRRSNGGTEVLLAPGEAREKLVPAQAELVDRLLARISP